MRDKLFYVSSLSNFVFLASFPNAGSLAPSEIGSRYAFMTSGEERLAGDTIPGRSWLSRYGVDWSLAYKTEDVGNISGKGQRVFEYAHEVALHVDINWTKLAGIPNFRTHMLVINRAGRNLLKDVYGDPRISTQELYGSGGNVLAHLVWFYGETGLFNRRVGLHFGRLPVATEVAGSPLYCQFSTLCSAPNTLKRETAFTVWPKSNWGIAATVRPALDDHFTIGVFDSNPNYGGPSGWSWFDGQNRGVLVPMEHVWQPYIGPHGLVGHYKIGYAVDTARYAPLSRPLAHGRMRHTWWVEVDQMLWRTGALDTSGVILFGGYAHNSGANSVYHWQAFGGVDAGGIVPGRPADRPGLVFSHYEFNRGQMEEALALESQGRPTGTLPMVGQNVLELKYNAALMHGLRLTPQFLYIVHPAATRRYGNACAAGFTLSATL